jgi:hypothetical protein
MRLEHLAQVAPNRHTARSLATACRRKDWIPEDARPPGQFPTCFEHSQHLANCVNGRWNEQSVCEGDIKLSIAESAMVRRSANGGDHFGDSATCPSVLREIKAGR